MNGRGVEEKRHLYNKIRLKPDIFASYWWLIDMHFFDSSIFFCENLAMHQINA